GVRRLRWLWNGCMQARPEALAHPTQKPTALMAWCMQLPWTRPWDTVLDPFAGAGSTLVAAKALGRSAIGIEIEERYCEIAAQRLSQDILPFGTPAPAREAEQLPLLL